MNEFTSQNVNDKLQYAENYFLARENLSEDQKATLKKTFSYFKSEFLKRWSSASRNKAVFSMKNIKWLSGTFEVPKAVLHTGRPLKDFGECSNRSKIRKTEDLRKNTDPEVLTFAAQVQLYNEGKRDASKILKDMCRSPGRANKYKKLHVKSLQESVTQLSKLKALSMFVEAGLNRNQYEVIRRSSKNLYPCYSILQEAKKECYPVKEAFTITDTCAEVNLQSLMDHTVQRLMLYLEDVIEVLSDEEKQRMMLISKWGSDGSQQSKFKQKFENDSGSDANIFQSSFVPLQLVSMPETANEKVIWKNPVHSSPRYCRPIRIRFVQESTDIINEEINYIRNAVEQLNATTNIIHQANVAVKHKMLLTMVDGKVCNAVTNTRSTMRCFICGKTSKDFNHLTQMFNIDIINPGTLQFGLSILHSRIRIFESLLHLSYKLPVKKWQIRNSEEKDIVKKNKARIQAEFKNKMGLLVDIPKVGFGNTNDGNTARRFFSNEKLSAEILEVDSSLIYRFKIILETISSGHKVDTAKFDVYCKKTAKAYVELYPWCPMTPTMHKILIHGPVIVDHALLPIGQLSEEALEARNKHFRSYRQNFARKRSRTDCNMDVIKRLLLTSDPLLSSIRPLPKKKSKAFSKETLEMLISAQPTQSAIEETHSCDESDESIFYSSEDDELTIMPSDSD